MKRVISIKNVINNNYNLDLKNPNKSKPKELKKPEEIVFNIISKEKEIMKIMKELQSLLSGDIKNTKTMDQSKAQ